MGKGLNNCIYPPRGPCTDFNWVFEYQTINCKFQLNQVATKEQKAILSAEEKGPQDRSQVVVWVIHLNF